MNLKLLAEPFAANEVEWRVGQAGKKGEEVWAKVLAYITNRAIMERLDEVCGPESWRNEFRYEPSGAILCGISIRVVKPENSAEREWVTKWDGAEATDIEAVKGGLSNAMKRAAVQWGIGRYLYDLEEGWAKVHANGAHWQAAKEGKYPAFKWDPPALPEWALPTGTPEPAEKAATPATDRARARVATPAAEDVAHGSERVVRGKKLADYGKDELNEMAKALRAEGSPKHKWLLADIASTLNDRLLGPSKKNTRPLSDEARGQSVKDADAATATDPSLPF